MLELPPLNALKSFEAAARSLSYVTAAEELNVTPAAISQQVKRLEDYLGRKLFTRFNNRIQLTDAGQAILLGITPAFEDIAALTARVTTEGGRTKLAVSVLPSVASCWFMPLFVKFVERGIQFKIDLRVEDDPVDFSRQDIDLRICYGTDPYPDLHAVPLFHDVVQPMCSPDFIRRQSRGRLDLLGLADNWFIHTSWGPSFASHPSWPDWFQRFDPSRRIDPVKGHKVGMSMLALEFAKRGLGVALGQRVLAEEDIASGRLVLVRPETLPLGHGYCAVYPPGRAQRPGLQPLIRWLAAASASDPQTPNQRP